METFDFLLPENFYAIHVGMINLVEMENLKQIDPMEEYRMRKMLEERTILITHERNKSKSLFQFLEGKNQSDKYSSYLQSNWQEELKELLASYGYIPSLETGKVCNFYPTDLVLKPEEEDFPFYFALRLRQLRFHQIDDFLSFQVIESYQNDYNTFHRFLTLTMREYKETVLSEDLIKTIEEWIAGNASVSCITVKKKPFTQTEKIICKADAETIRSYFNRLVKLNVLDKPSVEHILYYAFAVFEKEVPALKFTPENVKKGDLMKFVHHFFTLYSYSRLEAGQWIKRLLVDSMTSFDNKDKTQIEIIEYIKDNWSKEPALYRFRK